MNTEQERPEFQQVLQEFIRTELLTDIKAKLGPLTTEQIEAEYQVRLPEATEIVNSVRPKLLAIYDSHPEWPVRDIVHQYLRNAKAEVRDLQAKQEKLVRDHEAQVEAEIRDYKARTADLQAKTEFVEAGIRAKTLALEARVLKHLYNLELPEQ
jgi:hypothetical protein